MAKTPEDGKEMKARELHGVLLIPNQSQLLDVVLPDEEHLTDFKKCFRWVLETEIKKETAKQQTDKNEVLLTDLRQALVSVHQAPEFEIGTACSGLISIVYTVHGGEPKRYGQHPNKTASKLLNLWNLHGPILCLGLHAETGDLVTLTAPGLMSLLKKVGQRRAPELPFSGKPIYIGGEPAYDKDGNPIDCIFCLASAVSPAMHVAGKTAPVYCCSECAAKLEQK